MDIYNDHNFSADFPKPFTRPMIMLMRGLKSVTAVEGSTVTFDVRYHVTSQDLMHTVWYVGEEMAIAPNRHFDVSKK